MFHLYQDENGLWKKSNGRLHGAGEGSKFFYTYNRIYWLFCQDMSLVLWRHRSSRHKTHMPDHSLTSLHLTPPGKKSTLRADTHLLHSHRHEAFKEQNGKGFNWVSLIIIELPRAFLAPWLLFHRLIIFISQIVESSLLPAWHRYCVQLEQGNFNVFLPSNWLQLFMRLDLFERLVSLIYWINVVPV